METTPSREVFVNILPWMRVVFYAVICGSLAALIYRIWDRAQLWRQGQPGGFERDWRLWLNRLAVYALAQKRVHRKSLGGLLHVLLASGFVVLTIGTTLLAIADQGPVNFHRGLYYLVYELVMDVFGVALCLGCVLAMYRRAFQRPPSLGHDNVRDWTLLGILLGLGVTGFIVEALRLHFTNVDPIVGRWSVIGEAINATLLRNLDVATTRGLHLGFWWLHALLVAGLFASIPVTRFLHVLTGPANIATRPQRPIGALAPLSLEEVEKTGKVGVSTIKDFTRQQLLSLDACMECGRCQDVCPAWATGKPLSPKNLVLDLRKAMQSGEAGAVKLPGSRILAETIWACTMCQACVEECPVLIGHVDVVSDLRRNLVAEGNFSGPMATAVKQVGNRFNPYGRPNTERLNWAEGLEVPTVATNPNFDYLYWVGCAGAFDPRAQKVARAMVQLLRAAQVNFAVLGKEELCTGDLARRLGDEFLFQDLAHRNVQTLTKYKVRKVVTTCPHCFNTLQNEYPHFGADFEVRHHAQFLAELLASGRLRAERDVQTAVTFHDPCYLARVNDIVAAPRDVLRSTNANLWEMERHGKKTNCCGAGGGRMWVEEAPSQRVSRIRAAEALKTGAERLATGCPFCLNMLTDASASAATDRPMRVQDIAELLLEGQQRSASSAVLKTNA